MTKELTRDIIQWDIKAWKKAVEFWEKNIQWNNVHNALELGGREGGLSLWLALKNIQTTCSDLSNVKDSASPLHKRYKVSEFINYEDIDATKIPYKDHFDIIVFKSIIGGIGRDQHFEYQQQAFEQIYKALKPGGHVLFAENLVASPLHQLLRKNYVNWGNSWRYVSISEMKILLKDFSDVVIKSTGFLGTLGRNESQRNFLTSIDDIFLNRILPDEWKYIVYGIAQK